MQRCRNCGSSNEDDSLYCQECGQQLAARSATPETHATAIQGRAATPTLPPVSGSLADLEFQAPPPAPGAADRATVATIPGTNIVLSEGEKLWRSYPVLHFRPFRTRARGTIYVTDSRILLHAKALKFTGRTALLQEVRLETVTGFGSYLDRGLGALGFFVLLLFFLLGTEQLAHGSKFVGLVVLVIVGLVVFISYHYGRLGLQIFTSQSTVGPIAFGRFGVGRLQSWFPTLGLIGGAIGGVQASDVLYCFPEANAADVVAELGALVFDLNRKGTLESSQWEPSLGS